LGSHTAVKAQERSPRSGYATHLELAEDLGEAAVAEDDGAGNAGADEDNCQGPVVSAPALVPHRLAKGAVGSL
jgi:hypothetical protein